MQRYFQRDYRNTESKFGLLQEYMLRPLIIFLGLFGLIILYLLAKKENIVIPGLLGGFLAVLLGQYFGLVNARANFLEIGFTDTHYYLRSAYDIAFRKNLKFYPLQYANATLEGDRIFLNYIDQTIRLRTDEWADWHEIFVRLTTPPSPVSFA